MGDQENQTVSFQGAQTEADAKPLPQAEGEKGAVQESAVTKEAEHLTQTISQEVAKQVQSYTDRLTAHIDKRFGEFAGKQTPPIASENPVMGNQINNPEVEKAAIAAQVITELGNEEIKKIGVQLFGNDPEISLIDQSSPSAYVQSCRKAAETKAKRLNTPSEGRLAGMPGGQYSNEDAEAIAAELDKLQQNPSQNVEQRKALRAKLASLTKK